MAYRGVWFATGLLVGLLTATTLVGCTAEQPATTEATTGAPTPRSVTTSYADQFGYLPPAGATLANATLEGSGSCPSGPVRIVVTSAHDLEVRVPRTPATAGVTFRLSTTRTGPDNGLPASAVPNEQLGAGIGQDAPTDTSAETVFLLRREMRSDRGDLTYFHSIRCEGPDGELLEQAPLTWTPAPVFTGIHPVDSGARPHARGNVVIKAGVLTLYNIAPDDTLEAIAKRFSVQPVELLYINPSLGYDSPQILNGDALNLDSRIR